MRAFSDFEKKIIERMVELDEKSGSLNVLGNIFDSFSNELSLPDYCYIKIDSETDVFIQIKKDIIESSNPPDLRVIDDELSKILLTTVKLFEYLEDRGLAYFIGDLDLESLGQVWANEEYNTCDFLESESKKLIYKYTRKKIYLTEELKILLKNDFKTKDHIRHEEIIAATKRELNFTRIALLLTFIGLLSSILVPLFSTTQVEMTKEIKVSHLSSSAHAITEEFRILTKSMDNINGTMRELQEEMKHLKVALFAVTKKNAYGSVENQSASNDDK